MALADVLSNVIAVQAEKDGALTVQYDETFASLREVAVAEGLEMVSLTQLLAWDMQLDEGLRRKVATQANKTMLGAVVLIEQPGNRADVMLRYNFPAGGLADQALQTLVLMALDGGTEVRRRLLES